MAAQQIGFRAPSSPSLLSCYSKSIYMEAQGGLPGQGGTGKMPPQFYFKYFKNDLSVKRVPAWVDVYK